MVRSVRIVELLIKDQIILSDINNKTDFEIVEILTRQIEIKIQRRK
jgi:hypothetical protein